MVARVRTVAFQGVDVLDIDVQVQMSGGIVAFNVVGLPDKAVAESRERVRAALHALGLALPAKRITVNLSPADVLKEGSHFDLPIAIGLLVVMNVLPGDEIGRYLALGELALDGVLTRVAGVLPAALRAGELERGIVCPASCGREAAWAGDVDVLAPDSLLALINHFKGTQVLTPVQPLLDEGGVVDGPDLREVKGQETAKRALEVAASGGHNMLMIGPPGSGKSMLAARLPGLLPPLSPAEALEVSMVHSVAGLLEEGRLMRRRPYRDPHHSASLPALVGGGTRARPGEISLAHLGVLFLDELPEFPRPVLESLRQPLETGRVVVARANHHVTYPARVQLVAAMNPCRCGYLGNPALACRKAPGCGADYQSRLSGPLLDRIDLHVEVAAVNPADLGRTAPGEDSATVGARVAQTRALQRERFGVRDTPDQIRRSLSGEGRPPLRSNADLDGDLLERYATPDQPGQALLQRAAEALHLSGRGYHRVLRVARTLADMEGSTGVHRIHVAEALSYRRIAIGAR